MSDLPRRETALPDTPCLPADKPVEANSPKPGEVRGRDEALCVGELQRQLAEALILLERFEFLPYGATVARRVVDGVWITDDEVSAECHQPTFTCPVCTWPQRGHNGPGRIHGNAENTHEAGCSMYAVLHGKEAPRIARDRVPKTHPLAEVFRV